MDFKKITDKIQSELPGLARKIILENLDLNIKENNDFFNDPDGILNHNHWWHQWGIISHSIMTAKIFEEEVPLYLSGWHLLNELNSYMNNRIDTLSKRELFIISIYFHDIGKFKTRKINTNLNGETYYSFKGHEKASKEIIRGKYLKNRLKKDFALTEKEINYIAECAGLHYELGKLRDEAKKCNYGYTKKFTESSLFEKRVREIIKKNPSLKWETGLFFLADTFGKTDLRLEDENDKEEIIRVKKEIIKRNLVPDLIKGVIQLPVGLTVLKKYFEICNIFP